jgi:hypothetical protein
MLNNVFFFFLKIWYDVMFKPVIRLLLRKIFKFQNILESDV